MGIELIDVEDAAAVEQLLDVRLAAHEADEPDNPAPCRVHFRVSTPQHTENEDIRFFGVRADDRIVGYAELHFPIKDNLHFAYANVFVHPEHRRRGLGRSLVEHVKTVTRDAGRKNINIDVVGVWENGPKRFEGGRALLESCGFELALTSVNRHADITTIDPAEEQRLLDESLAKSDEYETIAWHHRVPEELLAPLAELNSIFLSQTPLGGLALEEEKIDAERMRKNGERSISRGVEAIGVVARRKGSTKLAATSVIGVPTEPGDVGHQWITLVDPDHRGHRLGMRVKVENLRQLREVRPKVTRILTDNADSNAHMIAINEALGFKAVDALYEYQADV